MTIQVGDKLPSAKLRRLTPEGIKEVTTDQLTSGKKVVLFAVPGAFTPTCSERHLPGFLEQADALKAKGVDARLLWFPDENHWVLKPRNSKLWYGEFFDWLRRHDPHARKAAPPRR